MRAPSFRQALGKRVRDFPLRITRLKFFVRGTSNLRQKLLLEPQSGCPGNVVEMKNVPSVEDRRPPQSVRHCRFCRRLARDRAQGGIRDTAKAAGRVLIGRVLSFRERTGIRSGDPYFAMLPRSSGPSTHILRVELKMSEIRLQPVLPADQTSEKIE